MDHNRYYQLNRQDSNISNTSSDFFTQTEQRKPVRKLVTPTSSLEFVDGDTFEGASAFGYDRSPSEASVRSRSSVGSVPPRSDSSLSRRTLTPTKQVSLQAVRRKEESLDFEPFVDHVEIDVDSVQLPRNRRKAWEFGPSNDDIDFSNLSVGDQRLNDKNKPTTDGSTQQSHSSNGNTSSNAHSQNVEAVNKQNVVKIDNRDYESSSSDDDDGEDEDKDVNEKNRAPTELLMEFIDCLMKKDFPNASKLCKMILLYEPENEEALKFQPLIEEKMALDAEAAAEEEEGSTDDDDDDDDDDDSDDDSSSEEDDSSDDDDDDNDDDKDGVKTNGPTPQVPTTQAPRVIGANTTRVWKPAS